MTRFDPRLHVLWVVLGGLLAACPSGGGQGPDRGGLADLAVADRTGGLDASPNDAAPDAAVGDSGSSGPDLTPDGVLLSQGSCSGRAGHTCSGLIALYRAVDGDLELRFPSNFSVTSIPAGEVYLSSRSALGDSINPGDGNTDVFLGTLQAFTGAQTYAVPAGAEVGRPYAWVWCRRVTVEVGVALLTPQP